jgi:hypothetical protein
MPAPGQNIAARLLLRQWPDDDRAPLAVMDGDLKVRAGRVVRRAVAPTEGAR